MPVPSDLKTQGDVVYFHVKTQPRASRNEIGEAVGHELKIKITAPPVDSAANEALVKFLAEALGCLVSACNSRTARPHGTRSWPFTA